MVKAWYMDDNIEEDQRLEHHLNPPKFISLDDLYQKTGIEYFKINLTPELDDQSLKDLRNERNYDYEDEITCSKDSMKNYDQMLKNFYTEHLHDGQEIRLVLEGSGYFDARDMDDKWIRILVTPGDLIILPGGIYHRFTLDTKNFIRVKRYFIGQPVWTPYNRPVDEMECRKQYLNKMTNGGVVYN